MTDNSLLARWFWNYMCTEYNTQWIYKPDAWEAKAVASFLDLIGIIDKKTFMKRFSFVLGDKIYLPFIPGKLTEEFPIENQISAAIHEHQHIYDARKMGTFFWNINYAFSKSKRAVYEANAYQTNIEVHHWYTGKILDPVQVANVLKNYGCKQKHIDTAAKILKISVEMIKKGFYESEATLKGLKWLEEHKNSPIIISVPPRFILKD